MEGVVIMLIFIAVTLELLVLFAKYDKARRSLELKRISVERFCRQAEARVAAIVQGNEITKKKMEDLEGRLADFNLQNEADT